MNSVFAENKINSHCIVIYFLCCYFKKWSNLTNTCIMSFLRLYGTKKAFGYHGYIKDIIIILVEYFINIEVKLVSCEISWKSVD